MTQDRLKLLKQLPRQQQALLSDLWEDVDRRKALATLLTLKKSDLKEFIATEAPDMDFVIKGRGALEMADWLYTALHELNRMEHKREAEEKAKQAEAV